MLSSFRMARAYYCLPDGCSLYVGMGHIRASLHPRNNEHHPKRLQDHRHRKLDTDCHPADGARLHGHGIDWQIGGLTVATLPKEARYYPLVGSPKFAF
jgi:hypothetical protein